MLYASNYHCHLPHALLISGLTSPLAVIARKTVDALTFAAFAISARAFFRFTESPVSPRRSPLSARLVACSVQAPFPISACQIRARIRQKFNQRPKRYIIVIRTSFLVNCEKFHIMGKISCCLGPEGLIGSRV